MTWEVCEGDALTVLRTMEPTDVAYLAGLIDGEGYIGVKRSGRSFHARIQVRMVDEPAIAFLRDTLGGSYYREKEQPGRRPLYCWQASDAAAARILHAVLPYLRVKREQAETVLAFRMLQAQGPQHLTKIVGYRDFPNAYGVVRRVPNRALSDDYITRCEEFWQACKRLNRPKGGDAA